jgi:hypothetical protein
MGCGLRDRRRGRRRDQRGRSRDDQQPHGAHGAAAGIELVPAGVRTTLYSDSQLAVKTLTEWAPAWEARGWRRAKGPVENLDLVRAPLRAGPFPSGGPVAGSVPTSVTAGTSMRTDWLPPATRAAEPRGRATGGAPASGDPEGGSSAAVSAPASTTRANGARSATATTAASTPNTFASRISPPSKVWVTTSAAMSAVGSSAVATSSCAGMRRPALVTGPRDLKTQGGDGEQGDAEPQRDTAHRVRRQRMKGSTASPAMKTGRPAGSVKHRDECESRPSPATRRPRREPQARGEQRDEGGREGDVESVGSDVADQVAPKAPSAVLATQKHPTETPVTHRRRRVSRHRSVEGHRCRLVGRQVAVEHADGQRCGFEPRSQGVSEGDESQVEQDAAEGASDRDRSPNRRRRRRTARRPAKTSTLVATAVAGRALRRRPPRRR